MLFNNLRDLQIVSTLLVEDLRRELKDQGHNMTGALSSSVAVTPLVAGDTISLIGTFLKYGAPLDTGVVKERVPYKPGSGKKESDYIDGLIRFVKLRRIATNDAEAKSIAFAIATKHKEEGIPTKESFTFSKNGRRRNWVSFVLKRDERAIGDLISDIVQRNVLINVDNIIKDIK